MNKTQFKKEINRRFYVYIENNFPQYDLDFDGNGRVSLTPKEGEDRGTNSIEYHQSFHEVMCLNWASKQTQEDTNTIQLYIDNNIIPFVNTFIEI